VTPRLLELPLDQTPSEAELQAIIEQRAREGRTGRPDIERGFARITWREQRRAEDPNAFLVPFSTDPQAFGSKEAYQAYRGGPVWKAQRSRVLDGAARVCIGCGAKATLVHHRDYRPRVIAGEDDVPLVALCRSCHDHLHERVQGCDPSWQESEARLAALVAQHNNGEPGGDT
jgi:hypothetical protein